MSDQATRVFIVDDHPIVRAGLREVLRGASGIEIVGESESALSDTAEAIASSEADVVVLDIKFKQGNGIDLCRSLKERQPAVGVILLSAFWDESLVRQALDARADGYLLKDAEQLDLKRSITSVARGESFFDTAVSRAIAREARGENNLPSDRELMSQDLTILRHVGEGLTNRAIAELLFLSPHTVRDRVSTIMALLGAKNRTEAAQMALKRNLI